MACQSPLLSARLGSARLGGAKATVWLVSTLKRSKKGKCLQSRGPHALRAHMSSPGSVSSQPLTRTDLLSLFSSDVTDGLAVIARSELFDHMVSICQLRCLATLWK